MAARKVYEVAADEGDGWHWRRVSATGKRVLQRSPDRHPYQHQAFADAERAAVEAGGDFVVVAPGATVPDEG